MSNPVTNIVIVGRDADAWITALMLQQSLHSSEQPMAITLVELPSDFTPQDFFSVLPSHKALHRALGVNENVLLRAAKGCYNFGQRCSNWSGSGAPYFHAYDRFGADFEGVEFFQYWLKATASGMKVPLEDFNLGAVAAKHAKYIVFDEIEQTFSQATYGYNLDAIRYINAIAKAAIALGIKHITSKTIAVKVSDARISALQLENGDEIFADFYIDASGSEAILLKHLEQDNVQSWASWLPVNRIMVASAPPLHPLPGFSQISAFKEGWYGIYPLLDRTAINIAYHTDAPQSQAILDKVAMISGLRISDATENNFAAAARKKHWIGNCLAIGSTAVSLEPLDAIQLHVLHIGLSLLRTLFPNDRLNMDEAELYNQQIAGFVDNIRDYQIAHYALNKRYGEPLWDKQRTTDLPAPLQRKIALFEARGLISLEEDETFQQENWTALFTGHHLQPKEYDPMVNKLSDDELIIKFQKLLGYIKSEVEKMPNLQAHIEMNLL